MAVSGSPLWEVTGGAAQGGILVREGSALASPEQAERLSCGAVVRQLGPLVRGERLRFELLRGSGPTSGWVSLKVKGKDLVVPLLSSSEDASERPAWLNPAAAKGKLLLLSVPWKGHMVHLRRIGAWFAGRPGYEVHIACFPEFETELRGCGFEVHLCEGEELQAVEFFANIEDGFRELAQATGNSTKTMLGISQGIMAEFADRGQDPLAAYFQFAFRIMNSVKADVIVGDAFCLFMDMIPSWCLLENISFIPVHSPGIPEVWKEDGGPADASSDLEPEMLARAMGLPVEIITRGMAGKSGNPSSDQNAAAMPQALPSSMTLLGALTSLQILPPQAAPFMTGAIAKKLKLPLKLVGQIIRSLPDVVSPAEVYPSTRSMVGSGWTRPRSLFTSPLLPLPAPLHEGGSVQRDRASFQESLAPLDSELLDWLYDEADPSPVVYVAFGSIVRPSQATLAELAAALDGEDWRVLWVLPESLEQLLPAPRLSLSLGNNNNTASRKWRVERFVPQADVLKCDRVKCFLSHCGANSTTESLVCGVPMLCCPFYMDQFQWAQAVCDHLHAGIFVDKAWPAEKFRAALQRVLGEPSFAEQAQRCSRVMRDQADAVLARLGPDMAPPPGTRLGPGTSVVAAVILACLARQSADVVFQIVEETTKAAEDAETAGRRP